MNQTLYSPQEVADRLGLEVRTVRHYVREGRLKGIRIGKQYRIAAEDVAALTGRPVASDPIERQRHVEVSSIVEIDAISPETVSRVSNLLMGAANARRATEEPLRIETIYDARRARLKLILVGGIENTSAILRAVKTVLDA